ncbi:unnamed protein product, partial [Laminaria digitata]
SIADKRAGAGGGGAGAAGDGSDASRPVFLTSKSVELLAMQPAGPSSSVLAALAFAVPSAPQQQHPSGRPRSPNPPANTRAIIAANISPRIGHQQSTASTAAAAAAAGRKRSSASSKQTLMKPVAGRPAVRRPPATPISLADAAMPSGLGSGRISHKRYGVGSADPLAASSTIAIPGGGFDPEVWSIEAGG